MRASVKHMQSRDTNLRLSRVNNAEVGSRHKSCALCCRQEHEIERDCAGSAGQRTQDRSSAGLGVPDLDNAENDAQEQ